ncbi:MAG: hypothetical protein M1814_006816 [Vezdaea aestivalis]|nr:MAG: hypothetical protein M1814_006816 [Vezdaea aestivalis]
MATPRLLQSAATGARRGARNLHITQPSTSQPTTSLRIEMAAFYLPRTENELRQECAIRALKSGGNKDELVSRLSSDDIKYGRSKSRPYTTRPTPKQPWTPPQFHLQHQQHRTINTSQPRKAVNDASTIDFVFLPALESIVEHSGLFHAPLAPDLFQAPSRATLFAGVEDDGIVARPQIATVASSSTHIDPPSAMSDVVDNSAISIDPYSLTKGVADSAANALASSKPVGEIRQFFNDVMDDVFGEKKKK